MAIGVFEVGTLPKRAETPPSRLRVEEPTPIPAVYPVSVKSGDGREITFDQPPERIVAFDSAIVEILFAIGEGERIVGTHQYVSYPPEAADIPRVGDAFNMDIEATVALEPDLVFVFFDRFVQDLERAGLKVLYIPSLTDDFEKIADHIRTWGKIVGNPNEAELVARDFEARVAAIRETMEPIGAGPTVLQDVGGFWAPGQGTMMQEVFDLLKLENVAHDIEGYAQISPEVIVERDPTIIFTSDPEGFTGEPAFESVRAVRHGTLLTLSTDALSIQGPRFIEGVEEMARLVYPGIFE
ncbi:MAG: ABC transporter substrate-binding protein [Dehalococcoidia bacterium]|nr:ABC transporter substrate-binding protein [Dehalococcoidia bacterium]